MNSDTRPGRGSNSGWTPQSSQAVARTLVTGWFSFLHGEATAGDLLALQRVRAVLDTRGFPHDVAWSPGFRRGGPSLDAVRPEDYRYLLFVCGPLHGPLVAWLHERFAHCRRVAVGVSVLDPDDPATAGFDVLLPRDGAAAGRAQPEGAADRGGAAPSDYEVTNHRGFQATAPGAARADAVREVTHGRHSGRDTSGGVPDESPGQTPAAVARPAPDLALRAPDQTPSPVTGVVLTAGQHEYGSRRLHASVAQCVTAWLSRTDCAPLQLETRLDTGDGLLCATGGQFLSLLARTDVVVTDRLHGLVLPLRLGIPVIAVDPVKGGAKVTAQARACRWPALIPGEEVDNTRLDTWWTWCRGDQGRGAAARRRRSLATATDPADGLLAALAGPADACLPP